jgi:mono/diheme cytochrome c family protein
MKALILAVLVMLTGIAGANAQSAQRGLNYLRANCARCHAIDKVSESPLKLAPKV